MIPKLSRHQLLDIAMSRKDVQPCEECVPLCCPGWISVPGYFDVRKLKFLGTLKAKGAEERWDEYHPNGTNHWSVEAPIAIDHHPYDRSDVRECTHCTRVFLHYTEYGGYYLDERIRALNPKLIV